MSNSQSFDFGFVKRMTVDNLIVRCNQYVEQYVSKNAAARLNDAYRASRFDEVKHIFEVTLERIKTKINVSEYQKAERAVINEFPDAKEIFVPSDTNEESQDENDFNEGSQDENMSTDSEIIAVIVISVAIIACIALLIFRPINKKIGSSNQTVGEVLSNGTKKSKYTEKDKDLMELIHELSIIYENTDQYSKSK